MDSPELSAEALRSVNTPSVRTIEVKPADIIPANTQNPLNTEQVSSVNSKIEPNNSEKGLAIPEPKNNEILPSVKGATNQESRNSGPEGTNQTTNTNQQEQTGPNQEANQNQETDPLVTRMEAIWGNQGRGEDFLEKIKAIEQDAKDGKITKEEARRRADTLCDVYESLIESDKNRPQTEAVAQEVTNTAEQVKAADPEAAQVIEEAERIVAEARQPKREGDKRTPEEIEDDLNNEKRSNEQLRAMLEELKKYQQELIKRISDTRREIKNREEAMVENPPQTEEQIKAQQEEQAQIEKLRERLRDDQRDLIKVTELIGKVELEIEAGEKNSITFLTMRNIGDLVQWAQKAGSIAAATK